MPLPSIVARLFLVLALLVGGVAPGAAFADGGGEPAASMASCHDAAGEPDAPPPTGCCDDGACTCDCVQQAPLDFLSAPRLPRLAVLGVDQSPPPAALPTASAAPGIRPPIA